MSDNNKHIDDLFRDRFEGFELPVTDADFQAVQDGLKEKRKKRPIIWWFILAGLIITTGIFTYQMRDGDGVLSDNTHHKTDLNKKPEGPSANKGAIAQKEDQNNQQERAAEAQIQDHGSLFPDRADQARVAVQDPDTDNDSDEWSEDVEEDSEAPDWGDVFKPKPGNEGAGSGGVGSGSGTIGHGQGTGSGSGYGKGSGRISKEERERRRIENEKARKAYEKRKEEERKAREAEEERRRAEKEEKEKDKITPPDPTPAPEEPKPEMPKLGAGKKAFPISFYAGVMVRPTITTQQLSQENTAHASYSEYKGSNEQQKLHLDAGLILGAKYNSWTVQTGANLSQYQFDQKRIRYQLKDSFPVLDPQGQIIGWIYNNYRDTTVELTNSEVSYRTISVPVILGKDFDLGSKWRLHFQAGSQVSFLRSAEGFTVNSALDIREVNKLPLKQVHIGWNTNVGVSYLVKPNLAVRLDGNYMNLSSNLYESSYDAKAVLNNVGFKLSLMYELGKTK